MKKLLWIWLVMIYLFAEGIIVNCFLLILVENFMYYQLHLSVQLSMFIPLIPLVTMLRLITLQVLVWQHRDEILTVEEQRNSGVEVFFLAIFVEILFIVGTIAVMIPQP